MEKLYFQHLKVLFVICYAELCDFITFYLYVYNIF